MRHKLIVLYILALIIFAYILLISLRYNIENGVKVSVVGTIIFSQQVKDIEYTNDGGVYDLFMQTFPGGKVRLTQSNSGRRLKLGGAVREPRISPDGKRVLFVSDYAGSSPEWRTTMTGAAPYPYTLLNLWTLDIRTSKVIPHTNGDLGWHDAVWSPDGRYFAAVTPTRGGVIDQDIPITD
ncbi:MAG: TolB family protein [Armatimonadota bacterium]